LSCFQIRAFIALIVVCAASSTLLAAGPVIGVVTARGSFRVGGNPVNDNATLFDGSTILTGDSTPVVSLKDGARIRLGTGTNVRISGHVIELTEGIGEFNSAGSYAVSAKTLRIMPSDKKSTATVQVVNDHSVLVAANNAPVKVANRNGIPVAFVRAGATLSFDPMAASPAETSVTGCMLTKGGRPIVVDLKTFLVSELAGGDWKGEVGNRVTVTGESTAGTTVPIASQLLANITITRAGTGGCTAVASDARIQADQNVAAAPRGAAPGGATPRVAAPSTGGHHAGWIVGGVAVAAAGGGVAYYELKKNKS
jgi:hypothetical protein